LSRIDGELSVAVPLAGGGFFNIAAAGKPDCYKGSAQFAYFF